MSYLDDLKKKGQTLLHNVQSAANTAKNVYNAAQQGVQNVYNAATGTTPKTQQAQAPNTQPSPAAQPAQNQQNQQAMHEQDITDWAAEYDKVMSGGQTPTNAGGGTVQGTQPPVSNAAQSALGEGAGQWQAELDNVMAQIMGKGKFEYNMNGDAMYQQYADIYQNQANLGMQNAMAQAAALTGGYGSSYGQMVGQQAYAQQMQGLNDIGLELYDRAYAQDMAERSQLIDQYNMLAAREEQAYNRGIDERNFEYQQGRDKVSDSQWKAELDRMLANDEISQQQWQAEMDRALANDATANEQWQAGMDWQAEEFDKLYGEGGYYTTESQKDREHQSGENQLNREHDASESKLNREHESSENKLNREHDASESKLNREHDSSENKLARDHQTTLQNDAQTHDKEMQEDSQTFNKEMATEEHNWQVEEWDKMYGENGYMTKKDKQDQKNWQDEFDREGKWYDDAQEASKTTTKYEGEGALSGQNVPIQLANVPGLTTTNTKFFDENGNFKQAAVVEGSEKNIDGSAAAPKAGVGTMTYNIGGKEIKVQTGTSPYTNTVNPDAKKGVMANGYQPTHIGGEELQIGKGTKLSDGSVAPEYDVINGTKQTIYKTSDGQCWIWDDTENEYIKYGEPTKKPAPPARPNNSFGGVGEGTKIYPTFK